MQIKIKFPIQVVLLVIIGISLSFLFTDASTEMISFMNFFKKNQQLPGEGGQENYNYISIENVWKINLNFPKDGTPILEKAEIIAIGKVTTEPEGPNKIQIITKMAEGYSCLRISKFNK